MRGRKGRLPYKKFKEDYTEMIIQNNIPALNTFRQMKSNNTGSAKALEKLSSGLRINRAGDDAAGLAISEKMRAQIRGLNRASANAQDGISLVQSADGAMQEAHAVLHRMRELAVQSGNDVNEQIDRQAIQDEIDQLAKEIERISNTTEFNKKTILDGSLTNGKFVKLISGSNISSITLQHPSDYPLVNGITSIAVQEAGEYYNMTFNFALGNEAPAVMAGTVQEGYQTNLEIELSDDIMTAAGRVPEDGPLAVAIAAGDSGDVVAGKVRDILSNFLGSDWTVTASGEKVTVKANYIGNFEGDSFTITAEDTDIFEPLADAGEWTTDPTSANVQGTTGRDMRLVVNGEEDFIDEDLNQITEWEEPPEDGALRWKDAYKQIYLGDGGGDFGEVQSQQFSFRIDDPTRTSNGIVATQDGSDLTLQIGGNVGYSQTVRLEIESISTVSLGVSSINVMNHRRSQMALSAIDGGIQKVSNQRAALGAIQNRLEHTISNLDTVAENLQDSESRIRDVDMAKEMMNFTKFSILMQASQAMAAQANSLPQGILQLLR